MSNPQNPRGRGGRSAWIRKRVQELRHSTGPGRRPPQVSVWPLDRFELPGDDVPHEVPAAPDANGPAPDHGLRVDLLAGRLAFLAGPALLELTRSGRLELIEVDWDWWRAWRVASGVAGQPVGPMLVRTRSGWIDVAVGEPNRIGRGSRSGSSTGVRPQAMSDAS